VDGHRGVMSVGAGVVPVKAALILCCHHGVAHLGQSVAGERTVGGQGLQTWSGKGGGVRRVMEQGRVCDDNRRVDKDTEHTLDKA
jgi:hypothetical protein